MIAPTPLLDFFKRGEVPRDVRLLAAQGVLAPRAGEQLAILVALLEDPDPIVRETADRTLRAVPLAPLTAYLGRSDVPIDLREFFADRGVFPDEIPPIEAPEVSDAPLIEAGAPQEDPADDDEARRSLTQRVTEMGFTERLKVAITGGRDLRAVLIRDTNKMIAAAVLSNPRLTESEIESFARMPNVGEDVLRVIGSNRGWMRKYGVVIGLARNPKTPLALSLSLLSRLSERDLTHLSIDRNVPDMLRITARKKVLAAAVRK